MNAIKPVIMSHKLAMALGCVQVPFKDGKPEKAPCECLLVFAQDLPWRTEGGEEQIVPSSRLRPKDEAWLYWPLVDGVFDV